MSSCSNKVSYWIPRGYHYREYFVQCGRTDPHGDRAICDSCSNSPVVMREIERLEYNIKEDNAALASAGWGEM